MPSMIELKQILDAHKFDVKVERIRQKFYGESKQPVTQSSRLLSESSAKPSESMS